MLSCENLSAKRGFSALYRKVGVSVLEGGVLLVTARDTRTRTLFLRQLAGLEPARKGSVTASTEHVYVRPARAPSDSTVHQHLESLAGEGNALIPAALHYLQLTSNADKPCSSLPKTLMKRLALAPLLLHPVGLWLLDGVDDGLDAHARTLLRGLISSRTHKGGAIVMTCQTPPLGVFEVGTPLAILDLDDFL